MKKSNRLDHYERKRDQCSEMINGCRFFHLIDTLRFCGGSYLLSVRKIIWPYRISWVILSVWFFTTFIDELNFEVGIYYTKEIKIIYFVSHFPWGVFIERAINSNSMLSGYVSRLEGGPFEDLRTLIPHSRRELWGNQFKKTDIRR